MDGHAPSRENPAKYAAEAGAPAGMWRYRDLLPKVEPVMLGEGWTPLVRSRRYPGLLIKDEGRNPTGSLEDRRMSVAVSLALRNGVTEVACASTGHAGVALAAYASAAGLSAHVFLARFADLGCLAGIRAHGATVHRVEDPSQALGQAPESWGKINGDEGLKTLGYELGEQLGWQYFDAILAPAQVLDCLSQSFDDLERLGWLAGKRPRLYPAIAEDKPQAHEGLLLCQAGATGFALYEQLLQRSEVSPVDRVVLINPSAGALALSPVELPWSMPVGGIITPV